MKNHLKEQIKLFNLTSTLSEYVELFFMLDLAEWACILHEIQHDIIKYRFAHRYTDDPFESAYEYGVMLLVNAGFYEKELYGDSNEFCDYQSPHVFYSLLTRDYNPKPTGKKIEYWEEDDSYIIPSFSVN